MGASEQSLQTSDIDDTAEERARFPGLQQALADCDRILTGIYHQASDDAQRHQRHHRLLTLIAMVCGTAAVLFAILQLSNLVAIPSLKQFELVAAVAALTAVVLGLIAARRSQWLLARHRAERCRLLKFRFLTDPALWANASEHESGVAQLEKEAETMAKMNRADLQQWSEDDALPEIPGGPDCAAVPQTIRNELVEYYRVKRLQVQIDYFTQRLRKDQRADAPTRHLPALCFFLSVFATLGHFTYDLATSHLGNKEVSIVLITLAAAFPVLGSGIHTLRMAHEYTRNTSRFRAKVVVLIRIAESLRREINPETLFRELWVSEQVLESEHREWLRLMLDAEWFG